MTPIPYVLQPNHVLGGKDWVYLEITHLGFWKPIAENLDQTWPSPHSRNQRNRRDLDRT